MEYWLESLTEQENVYYAKIHLLLSLSFSKKTPYRCTRDDYQVSFVEWPFIIASKYCYLSLVSDTKEGSSSIFLDNLQVEDKKQVNKCVKNAYVFALFVSISVFPIISNLFMGASIRAEKQHIQQTQSANTGMISAKLMPCVISCRHFFNEHISKTSIIWLKKVYQSRGVWNGALEIILSNHSAQSRVCQAMSSHILNVSTASLDKLCQCQMTSRGWNYFLIFIQNFLCSSLCPPPLVLSLGITKQSLAPTSLLPHLVFTYRDKAPQGFPSPSWIKS